MQTENIYCGGFVPSLVVSDCTTFCEKFSGLALVVQLQFAQFIRKCLEERSYWDDSRRLTKVHSNHIAIPVNAQCAQDLIGNMNEKTQHGKITEHEHLWHGQIFEIEAKLVCMNLPPSKKAKITTPSDRLRFMIDGWIKEGKIEWKKELAKEIPNNWERHGDLVLLPSSTFQDPMWQSVPSLWSYVAKAMNCARIARRGRIQSDDFRSPRTELLLGTDTCVTHIDNGIIYTFNICYSMFSSGNITEKLRIADRDCSNETIVDLYAGIGYFTLPYLVHTRVKLLYACEWNPHAVKALHNNLKINNVVDRCIVLEGDNRKVCPKGVADRVNLGLIPSSQQGWSVACEALNPITGGILHIHGNVESYPQQELDNPCSDTTSDKSSNVSDPDAVDNTVSNISIDDQKRAADYFDGIATFRHQLNSEKRKVPVDSSLESCTDKARNISSDSQARAADYTYDRTTRAADYTDDRTTRAADYTDYRTTSKSQIRVELRKADERMCHEIRDKRLRELYGEFKKRKWSKWGCYVVNEIKSLLYELHGNIWNVEMFNIQHVKSYAPHIDHIVVDVRCRPIS